MRYENKFHNTGVILLSLLYIQSVVTSINKATTYFQQQEQNIPGITFCSCFHFY